MGLSDILEQEAFKHSSELVTEYFCRALFSYWQEEHTSAGKYLQFATLYEESRRKWHALILRGNPNGQSHV